MTAQTSNHDLQARIDNQLSADGASDPYGLLFNHFKQIISEQKAAIKRELHQTTKPARQPS